MFRGKGSHPVGREAMPFMLHATRQISGRAGPCALLQALANTRSCCVKPVPLSTRRPKHEQDSAGLLTSRCSTCTNIGSSNAASSHRPRLTRASPEQQLCGALRHLQAGSRHAASAVGPTRMFGGQSVVPWELALFLVEEVQ